MQRDRAPYKEKCRRARREPRLERRAGRGEARVRRAQGGGVAAAGRQAHGVGDLAADRSAIDSAAGPLRFIIHSDILWVRNCACPNEKERPQNLKFTGLTQNLRQL
jgi:hypothetical protein